MHANRPRVISSNGRRGRRGGDDHALQHVEGNKPVRVEPGIYVDDSGNPGVDSGSMHLSKTRKSWTAVIVPPSAAKDCSFVMDTFLQGIADDYGANELHFTEIFSGRGVWEKVKIEDRIQIFRQMSSILSKRVPLPIVHVTTSQETLNDHAETVGRFRADPKQFWNMSVPHIGFLRMCIEVADYVREMREDGHPDFKNPLPVFADEGLAVAGVSIRLPNWEDVIAGPLVNFAASQDVAGIQIADFAAFTIARTQWTVAQRKLGTPVSRSDEEFLTYGSGLNVVNLPKMAVAKSNLSKDSHEFILERDRVSKGLLRKPIK
ncbi:MAG: DUF3800 domain-containing protein [Pseudomonadota bacterium]